MKTRTQGKRVVVVGAGGNIGSHLAPHLARLGDLVAEVVLVDRDTYEEKNIGSQNIRRADIGNPKVAVRARDLRQLNPRLKVTACHDSVENLPAGLLRCDVLASCLDSRLARRHVNRLAWRLGVPLVDAGVEPSSLLARVNVYRPGRDAPCLECAWDEKDLELLNREYSCDGSAAQPAATNAASGLGALAAALQALEVQKLLEGLWDQVAVSAQVLIDARYHHFFKTAIRRNPACRFEHRAWDIRRGRDPGAVSLAAAFRLARRNGRGPDPVLRIADHTFVLSTWCLECGHKRRILRLEGRQTPGQTTCPTCGTKVEVVERTDKLERSRMPARALTGKLNRLGLRSGDIVTVAAGGREFHVQFGPATRED